MDRMCLKCKLMNNGCPSCNPEKYQNYIPKEEETSEQRQKRLNCNIGNGVNNWRCDVDCAFWDGEKCTNTDDEREEETVRKTLKEWEKIKDVEILDYDGFDRTDAKLLEKLFTEKEFDEGLWTCTCKFKKEEETVRGGRDEF